MKNVKRYLWITLVFLGIAMLVTGCGNSQKESSSADNAKETYRIGAVFDSSGKASSLGKPEYDTVKMMVDKINAEGGIDGHQIDLRIYDNKSDATEAVLVAKKMVQQDKVLAVVGSSTSGTTLAMVDSVQKAQIPLVSAAASIQIVEPVKDRQWVFKTAQSDTLVADKIIEYLKSKGLSKIAL